LQTTGIAYRDETWRLALAGATLELRAAAALLDGYDAHRARAFAAAGQGALDRALEELRTGADDDWPFPAAVALDRSRVRYLAGDDAGALAELAAANRADSAAAELVALVVARTPRPRRGALRLALAYGTPRDRLRNALKAVRGS
jgi:hypothetical protein